ncbi:hypothetical protein U14_04848 [Candidatus Moduliflexus flocculans]|uniref:HD/PDEase domain-containing protein n=1 Tax=Candidatus Moduliflexus flocculans TaxID=1499966 RepID=A0A0S6W794_9BACT|nr:hypothetical protein U14_04848 [Candidatus Moduliflexus flocculans]
MTQWFNLLFPSWEGQGVGMVNSYNNMIEIIETRWLPRLYEACQAHFRGVKLPSHDHRHHLRVWLLAKELLAALAEHGAISEDLIEGMLIAAMFHDVGMSVTRAAQHGRASRLICERWMAEQSASFIRSRELLAAIEHHDDKSYAAHQTRSERMRILPILAACDDLDAFGAIGVFRYAEIYLLRGIPAAELAAHVLPNLANRYRHFQRMYGDLGELAERHARRYTMTRRFYAEFAQQAYAPDCLTGAVGVINMFRARVIEGDDSPEALFDAIQPESDAHIIEFFQQFYAELAISCQTP